MMNNPAIGGDITEEEVADMIASFSAWSALHPDVRDVSEKIFEKYGNDHKMTYTAGFIFAKTLSAHEEDYNNPISQAFELLEAEVVDDFESLHQILYRKLLKSLKERTEGEGDDV